MTYRFLFLFSCLLLSASCANSEPAPEPQAAPEAAPEPQAAPETAPEASSAADASVEAGAGQYEDVANQLVGAIEGGQDAASVGALAERLTRLGLDEIQKMKVKHPVCVPYLDVLIAATPTMKDLPLKDIEADYHADGKLPKMPDPVCYHGKDLVVHPVTVVAMAKQGLSTDEARAAAKAEIVEVLAHLGAVEGHSGEAK